MGESRTKSRDSIKALLDEQVPGWRDDIEGAVRVRTASGEWLWVEYERGVIFKWSAWIA